MNSYEFNKDARRQRIKEQATTCLASIEVNWNKGISPVDLSCDTDIFKDVKYELVTEVPGMGLTRVNPKAFSVQGKNNKTHFRVINKNYL